MSQSWLCPWFLYCLCLVSHLVCLGRGRVVYLLGKEQNCQTTEKDRQELLAAIVALMNNGIKT